MTPVGSGEELRARLLWLTVFRVVANTLSMLAVALRLAFSLPEEPSRAEAWGFGIIAVVYAATLIYAIRLRRGSASRLDAWVQVTADILFATGIVSLTGWGESPFIITYSLAIIAAALLLQTRGALIVAGLATATFTALVLTAHLLAPQVAGASPLPLARLGFILLSNLLAFVLVAVLAGYLARQLVKAGGQLVEREQDLAQLSKLHRQILEAMPSGLMTADAQGRITFANPTAETILGRRDLLGSASHESLPGLSLLGRSASRRELKVLTPQGPRILGLSVTALSGEQDASLIVFQDLTELRRLEGELRKADQLALLGRMAAQMAHEIRNPLAAMRGSAQLLGQDPDVSPTAERLVRILVRESDRLTRLVEEVLRFSRPNVPNRKPVDLAVLASETVEMLREDPLATGVQLELEVETLALEVDPDQLRQVLLNLIRNALEAVESRGTVKVTVARQGDVACLRVRDSGPGMEEAVQARLFEPFFTTKQGGTGLGLATAHAMIHSHGGQLGVISTPSEGTEFEVRLPLNLTARTTPAPLVG